MTLPAAVWTAHAYAGHQTNEITLVSIAGYYAFVAVISGFLSIVVAATMALLHMPGRVHIWLGLLGTVQACCLYFGGLYVFRFRYPPHWTLWAMESVAAVGSAVAFVAAVALARQQKRCAAQH